MVGLFLIIFPVSNTTGHPLRSDPRIVEFFIFLWGSGSLVEPAAGLLAQVGLAQSSLRLPSGQLLLMGLPRIHASRPKENQL